MQRLEANSLIQFWHPRKGGWHTGVLLSQDRKTATVKLAIPGKHSMKVPLEDIRPAETRESAK